MEECTANILASISQGNTTVEGWQNYCKRFEQRAASDIDPYQYETYQGAREALTTLDRQIIDGLLTDPNDLEVTWDDEDLVFAAPEGGDPEDGVVFPILPQDEE